MCLADIKVGKESNCVTTAVTATTTARQVLSENTNRLSLMLCPPSAGTVIYSFGQQPGASLDGLRVAAGASPILMDIQHNGAFLRVPLFATMVAGTAVVTVVESIWGGGEQ